MKEIYGYLYRSKLNKKIEILTNEFIDRLDNGWINTDLPINHIHFETGVLLLDMNQKLKKHGYTWEAIPCETCFNENQNTPLHLSIELIRD